MFVSQFWIKQPFICCALFIWTPFNCTLHNFFINNEEINNNVHPTPPRVFGAKRDFLGTGICLYFAQAFSTRLFIILL